MKRICKLVIAFVALILTAESQAQNFTNRGKEFWVGYGHHQYMETSCDGNTQGDNTQNMVLYLSNSDPSQNATVTVSLDNSVKVGFPQGWRRTYVIPPNTVISTENLPKGSTNAATSGSDANFDARLWALPAPIGNGGEGIWAKKGIHIESNIPIVAYAHIYGGVSSGATMLLPIETWGYSYTSINSEQRDADRSFSWMYVIAKDNNTRIRVTPTALSRNGRPSGVPFTVDLQKGEIYQYIAQSQCSSGNGPELTGTKVKSIVGADGICHQIAVFSGSSRTGGETLTCGTGSGRDNDMQQGFPEHAWGKRYLTTPFSKASSGTNLQANDFMTSVYKIILKDAGTTVKRNGVPLTITGSVYKYSSNTADYIEADKPIMIAQYMSGTSACAGGSQGDPEMVYISPIEQAINNIGFYRNTKEAIVANYLTLSVPTTGLSSLYINNSQLFNHTYPHPQNPIQGVNYTVVVKGWAAAQDQVLVRCDSGFTAITYGLGGAESYGYNAGTYLKNLNAVGEVYNKPDTSKAAQPFTCTGTPMEISALVAYKPTSMNWRLSALGSVVTPNTDVLVTNPVPVDSVTIGIAKYYRYRLPGTYIFNTAGSYDLPIVCTSTDIDNCSLQEVLQIRIEVKARPTSNFTFTHSGCRTDSVQFNGPTQTGNLTANQWNWNFGDNAIDSIRNPKHAYPSTGTFIASLVVTSAEGCLSDTTRKPITIGSARPANITASSKAICQGGTVTFSDTTTVTNGTFYWDFGTGTPVTLTTNTPQTVTYSTPGIYVVKHAIYPTGNCVSDTLRDTITVYANPVKPVAAAVPTYCQGGTATALVATALTGHTLTWYTVFPLANGSTTAPVPSTATAGTFSYYVTQTQTLSGCVSDTTRITVVVTAGITNNTISANQTICSGSPAAALTGTQPAGGSGVYTIQWQQSFDGGATWSNIPGATMVSPYTPGSLSTGITKFRRIATSGLCTSTSNEVDITVQTNLSNFNISASPTAICEGAQPPLIDGQTPTGGAVAPTYQWQASTDGGLTWTVINGATLEDYQPGVLTVPTRFRRIATGGACPAISNVISFTLNPTANGTIAGPATICQYDSARITFTSTAGTAPFAVRYTITAPGGAVTTVNQTVATAGSVNYLVIPVNSAPGNYTIALQSVSDNGGCIRTTGFTTVTINVIAKPDIILNPVAPATCSGTAVNITATGAANYVWTPATGLSSSTAGTITATLTATTTYQVIGNTSGCADTANVTVTVNPIPAKPVPVTRSAVYCQTASSVQLTATALAGHSLTWYSAYPLNSGTATAPTPSTATAGTYSFYVTQTATTSGCVSDTSIITITVTPSIATNTIGADQTICSGTAAAPLTASTPTGGTGTYTYQWEISTNGGMTWTAIAAATNLGYNPGIQPTGVIRFRRIVTSGVCSSISNVVVLTIETNLNNYEISGADTICSGSIPNLIDGQTPSGGTGVYTYQWQSSSDGSTWATIAGATGEDYQPAALTATMWYRRITSGGNCPATSQSVRILVNPLPNAALTGPTGICSYDSAAVNFTASAGTAPFTVQLLITAPGGTTTSITRIISGNGPVNITVLPINSAGGNYTVQLAGITDANGCSRTTGMSSVSIAVTTKPTVTVVAANSTICAATSTQLTANGATTYAWTPSSALNVLTGATVTATPTDTTDFEVVGSTNGCRDTAEVRVNAVPRPLKPIVNHNLAYCVNATAQTLTATGTGNNTITWYTNAALTNGTTTAPTPSTSAEGTVTYYVTQTNSSGCISDTAIVTVVTHPLPVVRFTLPPGICMPNGTGVFTNNTTISSGGGTLNYAWDFGDNLGTSTATSPTYGYLTSGSYAVSLTATSSFGCTASSQQTMSAFFEKPEARFDVNPTQLCQGQNNNFTDRSNPRGSTITRWQWLFGDGKTSTEKNPVHRYDLPGDYTVKLVVTTAIGCVSDTFTQDVKVYLQPKIDAGPSFTVPAGTVVQFKATANDTTNVSLLWTPPIGLSNPTVLQPTTVVGATQSLTGASYQTYTLTATGAGGCIASDTLTVRVLQQVEIPNAFSPNGDGINDRWLINNLADYPGAKVEVYNRWGQQVYLSYGYNKTWDGTYLGKPLPLATYYYIITLKNGFAPVKGSVTIVK